MALALTAMLCAVTGQVAVQVITAKEAVRRAILEMERPAVVLDAIEADLARSIRLGDHGLRVFGAPSPTLEMTCLAAVDDQSIHAAMLPTTVRYRLLQNGTESELVRERVRLVEREEPVRGEVLSKGVTDFRIEARVKSEWLLAYPTSSENLDATALRITLRWDRDQGSVVRTFALSDAR